MRVGGRAQAVAGGQCAKRERRRRLFANGTGFAAETGKVERTACIMSSCMLSAFSSEIV